MNLSVYLVAITVLLTGITVVLELQERKKEKVRLEEIKKAPQGRPGHNPRGDFFYDWYEG